MCQPYVFKVTLQAFTYFIFVVLFSNNATCYAKQKTHQHCIKHTMTKQHNTNDINLNICIMFTLCQLVCVIVAVLNGFSTNMSAIGK
jgi:hypothetical protein